MSSGFESLRGAADKSSSFPVVPRTSGLAVGSLIVGLLSLVPCAGLLFAPVAILMGHISRSTVRRSGGRITGGGLAACGLLLAYVSLAANLAFLAYIRSKAPSRTAADTALLAVERKIASDRNGFALGNSEQARELARTFATMMETIDKEAFTQTGAKLKLSGGHYVTWCELRPGRCAFVVHVPEYRRFSPEAKQALAKIAWAAAQKSAQGALMPGDQLAVGLKGVLLYGAVMIGQMPPEGEEFGDARQRGEERALLFPFFADTPAGARAQPAPGSEVRSSGEQPQ